MPRADNIYAIPPGTEGVPDETIASTPYNSFVHDVEFDLNAARPVVAGGTGATSATQARANLQAERAAHRVTNYGGHVWEIGSFYSTNDVVDAPVVGHAFTGIVYGVIDTTTPANTKLVIEARDLDDTDTPGTVWVREKIGTAAWSTWTGEGAFRFVDVAGDTMTGDLTITKNTPAIALNRTDATPAYLFGTKAGLARWALTLGNATAETGTGNVGSDFALTAFNDAGTILSDALLFDRATQLGLLKGDPTAPLGVATKQYVDARALDAMAYNGMQINGSCEVSQDRGSTSFYTPSAGVAVAAYIQDGWLLYYLGAATLGVSAFPQFSDGPPGFSKSVMLQAAAGLASLAANDYVFLHHPIEGYRVARLGWGAAGAQPITIGFWVRASVTGTVSVTVRNVANTRSYITDVTISAAATWEYKTLTVPGDTTGTWAKDNTAGITISICSGAGSSVRVGTAGSWTATGNFATSATTNFFGTNGNTINITGLTVLPGSQAPTAAQSPLIMRPYDQELVTCQRYYQKILAAGAMSANGTAVVYGWGFPYPVELRANPTVSLLGTIACSTPSLGFNITSIFANGGSSTIWRVAGNASVSVPTNPAIVMHDSTGYCIADARL